MTSRKNTVADVMVGRADAGDLPEVCEKPPILMKRAPAFGRYLAWTFFASMGLTELAHFVVFQLLDQSGYHYVPGMWTVLVLAPVAWFGMWRLCRGEAKGLPANSGRRRRAAPSR